MTPILGQKRSFDANSAVGSAEFIYLLVFPPMRAVYENRCRNCGTVETGVAPMARWVDIDLILVNSAQRPGFFRNASWPSSIAPAVP